MFLFFFLIWGAIDLLFLYDSMIIIIIIDIIITNIDIIITVVMRALCQVF